MRSANPHEGRPAKNMVLVGLQGVGKAVLLDLIWEEAEASGSYALRIEAPEDRSLPSIPYHARGCVAIVHLEWISVSPTPSPIASPS